MTEKKKNLKTVLILTALPAALIVVFLLFGGSRGFCNFVALYIGRPYRFIAGLFSSAALFSVMEALYAAAVIFFILYIIKSVIATVKSSRRLFTAISRVLALIAAVFWIFAVFLYSWGANYRSDSFTEMSGMTASGCSAEELREVAGYFARRASDLSSLVPRNEKGVFAMPADEIISDYSGIYDNLEEEFPFLHSRSFKPKSVVFSKVMSAMGFTGVYFSFTGETNLNVDVPTCLLPVTVAHELAHQKGFASEQECNFLGVASSAGSGNLIYEYSGCLAGLLYTSNALYSADKDAWLEVISGCSDGVLADFADNNDYWAGWESPVEAVAESAYDGYLKAQGQELGIKSYGACVDLIVEYYLPLINQ